MSQSGKDARVTEFIAAAERAFGSMEGAEVKWHDGRIFRMIRGRWVRVAKEKR